jgi:hypothetical protein
LPAYLDLRHLNSKEVCPRAYNVIATDLVITIIDERCLWQQIIFHRLRIDFKSDIRFDGN